MLQLGKIKNTQKQQTLYPQNFSISSLVCLTPTAESLENKIESLKKLDLKLLQQINNIKEFGYNRSSLLKEFAPAILTGSAFGVAIYTLTTLANSTADAIANFCLAFAPLAITGVTIGYLNYELKHPTFAPDSAEALQKIEELTKARENVQADLTQAQKELRTYYIKAQTANTKKENNLKK